MRPGTTGAAALLMDLVVPVAVYYLLRALGLDPLWALVLAGVPTVVFLAGQALRRGRIDALGVFVLVLVVACVGVSLVTGSPRFLLAKSGAFTGLIGLGFLATLLLARPLPFTLARAMLERLPVGARLSTGSWDDLWDRSRWFRRVWRVDTVIWSVGLLADALVRVVMAYALPIDTVPALAAGLWAVTFVCLQVVQHIYFTRTGLWRALREQSTVPAVPGRSGAAAPDDRPGAPQP